MNESGIQPVEFKCLVRLDKIDEQTSGGLFLPESARTREQWAQVKAMLVAVGGNAFEEWSGKLPVVGNRIYIAKHSGYQVTGSDGQKYQLIQDKDIAAIIEQE